MQADALARELRLAGEASPSCCAAAEVTEKVEPTAAGGVTLASDGPSEGCGARHCDLVLTRSKGGSLDDEPKGSADAVRSVSADGREAWSARSDNCLDCAGRCDRHALNVAAELDSRGDEVGVNGDADLRHAVPLER